MKTVIILAALAVFIQAFSGCSFQDKVEQAVENEVSTAVSNSLADTNIADAGMSVPEGYPTDVFPVYGGSDSEILGASRQSIDAMQMYNLVIGTDDATDAVEARIREEYEGRSSDFEQMTGGGMFTGVVGQWRYSIVINDGQADGFGTVVTYVLEGE